MENNLKKIRKKLNMTQKDFAKILKTSQSQISLYEKGIKTIPENLKNYINSLLSKKEINEFEKEVLETYEMMRNENNIFSKIASINRVLIDFNKELEGKMLILDTLITDDTNVKNKIKNPIKTTLKNLKKYQKHLEEILDDSLMVQFSSKGIKRINFKNRRRRR